MFKIVETSFQQRFHRRLNLPSRQSSRIKLSLCLRYFKQKKKKKKKKRRRKKKKGTNVRPSRRRLCTLQDELKPNLCANLFLCKVATVQRIFSKFSLHKLKLHEPFVSPFLASSHERSSALYRENKKRKKKEKRKKKKKKISRSGNDRGEKETKEERLFVYLGVFFCLENLSPESGSHWARSSSLKLSTGGSSASSSDEPEASLQEPLLLVAYCVAPVGSCGEPPGSSGVPGFLGSVSSPLPDDTGLGLFASVVASWEMLDESVSSHAGCPGDNSRRT